MWLQVQYSSCSEAVMAVLAPDTMKSSKHLLEDLLAVMPVLLYQVMLARQQGWPNRQALRVQDSGLCCFHCS